LARDGAQTVGAGRYYVVDDATVQIGRMAVLAAARNKRVGTELLAALVAAAARNGFARAHLHAQTHAREFYVRAGFHDDGEPLWDGGILHQPMSRDLVAGTP
ncbi:MAG: GNAT family N-acetyltransferase, partial [Candidatus Eremiobacteraeota bacterium]|nr:GNAT family N-acetyltransferase [Candidatus Eremiobacteraeota bacterium]